MFEDDFDAEHCAGSEHHTQSTGELGGEGSSKLGRDSAVDADLASMGTHEPGGDGLVGRGLRQKANGGGQRSNPSAAKAEAKKRGAKTTKQGKVQCRGCRRYFPGEVYGVNNVFCPQDKKALDRIKNIAEAQGANAVKFYREARQDPDRVYCMLQNYFKSCPPPPPGQRAAKNAPKWDMVQYIEQVKCQSGTISDSVGVMMWRGQFIEFCKSAAGGHKAEAEAETEWNNLVSQWERDRDAFVWDSKSPNQRYPLRLRIVERDLSIMRNAYMHEKVLSMQLKGQKRASEEDLEKLRLKTMQDHDFAQQQSGSAFNIQDMARRMMKNSGESANAFVGKDVQIDDVTALIPEEEECEEEDEERQESEGGPVSASSVAKTPSKSPHKDGWWNRDVNINNARRSQKKSLELTRMNLEKTLGELSKTIEAVELLDEPRKSQFTHEITSGRSRLSVLQLVLGDDAGALQRAIVSFQPQMGESRRSLAPPCRSYADLVLLKSIEADLNRYDTVNTKEEMDMIPKDSAIKKRPLLDLDRSCKEAMASIVKAQGDVKAMDASKAKLQDSADQTKKRGRPMRQTTKNIIEHGLAHGTEVTCCSTVADLSALGATLDRSKPLLITSMASHGLATLADPKFAKVCETLDRLSMDLEAQKTCVGGSTRGQKPLQAEELALADEFMKSIVPHSTWCSRVPDDLEMAEALQRAMKVCAFGLMAKCEPWSCAEKCHLGCARFTFTGTRLMVMTPEASMFSFLGLRNPGVQLSFNDLWQYFRSMDDSLLQLYTEKNAPGIIIVFCFFGGVEFHGRCCVSQHVPERTA